MMFYKKYLLFAASAVPLAVHADAGDHDAAHGDGGQGDNNDDVTILPYPNPADPGDSGDGNDDPPPSDSGDIEQAFEDWATAPALIAALETIGNTLLADDNFNSWYGDDGLWSFFADPGVFQFLIDGWNKIHDYLKSWYENLTPDDIALAKEATAAMADDNVRQVVLTCMFKQGNVVDSFMKFNPIAWAKNFKALGVTTSSQIVCLANAAILAIQGCDNDEKYRTEEDKAQCNEKRSEMPGNWSGEVTCESLTDMVVESKNNNQADFDAIINCETEYVPEPYVKAAAKAITESCNVQKVVRKCYDAPQGASVGVTNWGMAFAKPNNAFHISDDEETGANQIKCLADAAIAAIGENDSFSCNDLISIWDMQLPADTVDALLNCETPDPTSPWDEACRGTPPSTPPVEGLRPSSDPEA